MSTYYKHKRTERVDVPYSFQCEQCMKESGLQAATITGAEAMQTSYSGTLSEGANQKLMDKAHANLVKRLSQVYKDASQKQVISTDFKDTCPHCGQPQSWGIGGMKKHIFNTAFAFLIIGAMVCVICYLGELSMTVVYGAAGITIIAALASILWNVIKISIKVKKTSASAQKNLPVIHWEAVQHLLNEKK